MPTPSTGYDQEVEQANRGGLRPVEQNLTPQTGSHWRARYEVRQRALAGGEENVPRTEGGTEEDADETKDPAGSLGDSSSEDGEGSEDEGNPLVKMKPGYVYDKRIDKVRKRTMMDDFVDARCRRLREQRKKKQRKK